MMQIHLVRPSLNYIGTYVQGMWDLEADGYPETREPLSTKEDFERYVKLLQDEERGENLRPGYVPCTTFWMIDEQGFAGRISLRHRLNDALFKFGGHIGYAVVPNRRKRGYASQALPLVLEEARKLGIDKVLLTCSDENVPSIKVIEKNSGVLERIEPGEEGKPAQRRYWIQL